jgi:hypothetical protein
MPPALHRFEQAGKRYALDPETCFCFECDDISWDVIEYYPHTPMNRIVHLLRDRHAVKEIEEVIGELEWLRASKSILSPPKHDQLPKLFEIERGVKRVAVFLPDGTSPEKASLWTRKKAVGAFDPALLIQAAELLLARSEGQKELCLECVLSQGLLAAPELADACTAVLKKGGLSGKKVSVTIRVDAAERIDGHDISVCLTFEPGAEVAGPLRTLAAANLLRLAKLAKAVQSNDAGVQGCLVIRPGSARFHETVRDAEQAGFKHIEIDIDGTFVSQPEVDPAELLEGMRLTAVYYAERLLTHHYFRLDPIAPLFWRIYNGMPLRRQDPAGVNELAVDAQGTIYPSRRWMSPAYACGTLADNRIDEKVLSRF